MPRNLVAKILPHSSGSAIAKHPAWTTLPQQPVTWIHADHRVECDIDVNGVGRVRIRPGYNANVDEIRYGY